MPSLSDINIYTDGSTVQLYAKFPGATNYVTASGIVSITGIGDVDRPEITRRVLGKSTVAKMVYGAKEYPNAMVTLVDYMNTDDFTKGVDDCIHTSSLAGPIVLLTAEQTISGSKLTADLTGSFKKGAGFMPTTQEQANPSYEFVIAGGNPRWH
jgi:hypothetical protein